MAEDMNRINTFINVYVIKSFAGVATGFLPIQSKATATNHSALCEFTGCLPLGKAVP